MFHDGESQSGSSESPASSCIDPIEPFEDPLLSFGWYPESGIDDLQSCSRFRHGNVERYITPWFTVGDGDRKSTRLNSSHVRISYAVFCLKKKKKNSSRIITYKELT